MLYLVYEINALPFSRLKERVEALSEGKALGWSDVLFGPWNSLIARYAFTSAYYGSV